MASLDKEIKVITVKGQKGENGKSSYELAVEELHYSGTLEEWLESFSTPENYITRDEVKKVTQAEYDALEQAHQLIPDCYYIITDDTTYDDLIDRLDGIDDTISDIQDDILDKYNARVYTKELLLGTPDLSNDTGWISFKSTAYQQWNFPLDTLENITDMLEIKGMLRYKYESLGTTYYSIQYFTIRSICRGVGYSRESNRPIFCIGNINNRVLISIANSLNFNNNEFETSPSILASLGNGTPLTEDDLWFKIISIKEIVNY